MAPGGAHPCRRRLPRESTANAQLTAALLPATPLDTDLTGYGLLSWSGA